MTTSTTQPSTMPPSPHPLSEFITRLENGKTLLPHSDRNLMEVVGVLDSYGVVLDAYSTNLIYVAEQTFLKPFPFFKYFNGDITFEKLLQHWRHDRINYEYDEYCARTMMWHGGGFLDEYLDSPEFEVLAKQAVAAKAKSNPVLGLLNAIFPDFGIEQVRLMTYFSALGQFWRVMSDIFVDLGARYNRGEITQVSQVVDHVKAGLVADAARPITYSVPIGDCRYDIIPASAEMVFLNETAIPYVECIFFRGTPFLGTVSYNAQAHQIPVEQESFAYGALFADPLPLGGAGTPPTLLMVDMARHLPDYLHELYKFSCRGEDDLRVQIAQSFQKSMFCVTNAAIAGLTPHPLNSENPEEQAANREFFTTWMDKLANSRLLSVNAATNASCSLFSTGIE
ncbi:MAG: CO2 hydration protein [Cyanobacteria bacterium J06642_2]